MASPAADVAVIAMAPVTAEAEPAVFPRVRAGSGEGIETAPERPTLEQSHPEAISQ